ncbi:MAG: hypothetical protein ACRCUP_01885 [Mycoplasmatales bacterium]
MQKGLKYTHGTVYTKASVSYSISVGRVIGGGVSYTPGSTSSFSAITYSAPSTGTYRVYATPKQIVYDIYQQYRETDACTYDKLISSKTGQQGIPTNPSLRLSKLK